jgi:chaperone modulatory protein CbpM
LLDQLYDTRQRLLSLTAAVTAQESAVQEAIISAVKMNAGVGAHNKR